MHELYQLEDGTYSMLRAEDSEVEWHGLATPIPASAGFDGWANSPVFDWIKGRSMDTRFDSAQFGQGANLKAAAWAKAKAIIDGIKAANDAIAIAAT